MIPSPSPVYQAMYYVDEQQRLMRAIENFDVPYTDPITSVVSNPGEAGFLPLQDLAKFYSNSWTDQGYQTWDGSSPGTAMTDFLGHIQDLAS